LLIPDQLLRQKTVMMTCSVDLERKKLSFEGCGDYSGKIAAIEARIHLLDELMKRPSGFTNRERRQMRKERNFLVYAVAPDYHSARRVKRWIKYRRLSGSPAKANKTFQNRLIPILDAGQDKNGIDAKWYKHFANVL